LVDQWQRANATFLEGDLGTLELRDGSLALVEATTAATEATTTTSTTTTTAAEATATTTTATTTATEATTTSTATEATTATTVGRAGSAEVETQSTALKLEAVHGTVSSLGLLNGGVLDVTETLGAAGLGVSGQADAEDTTVLTEGVTESILGSAEGKVANEESVGGGAGGVTEGAGTVLGALALGLVVAGDGVVEVDGAAIDIGTLLSGHSLGGIGSVGELDVTETAGAARVTVGHDTAASELTELAELLLEPGLIDVPGQVADEQVGGGTLGGILSLGLLSGSDGLLISLALLGGLGLLLAVRVGGVGGVGVGVGRVL
jgi:hypothetical protein